MKTILHTLRQRTITISSIVVLTIVTFSLPVFAGPVTNPTSPPTAPFVKLGVYQGLISIVTGSNALEIGNAGRDIAATGDIYLLPGGHVYPNGVRVKKSDVFPQAAVDVGNGRVCLNADQAGGYQCVSSWAGAASGDTYWNQSVSVLSPKTPPTVPLVDVIRIGTDAKPVPLANGRALDIYSATAVPALSVSGALNTGYSTGGVIHGGNVRVAGKFQVSNSYNNDLRLGIALTLGGPAPWSTRDAFDPVTWTPSGIDTDTFDGNSALPFPTDHDLFWKNVSGGTALCLKTTATKLCAGGANQGADCSSNPAICTGGGVCTNMCQVQDVICTADPATKHCENGSGPYTPNRNCTTSNDCNSGDYCVQGRLSVVTSGSSSGCSGSLNCQTICSGQTIPRCDGTAGGPGIPASCSSFGSKVTSDNGRVAAANDAFGSCHPPQSGTSWLFSCDCYLGTDKPYTQTVASGGQAQLCTPLFSSLLLN